MSSLLKLTGVTPRLYVGDASSSNVASSLRFEGTGGRKDLAGEQLTVVLSNRILLTFYVQDLLLAFFEYEEEQERLGSGQQPRDLRDDQGRQYDAGTRFCRIGGASSKAAADPLRHRRNVSDDARTRTVRVLRRRDALAKLEQWIVDGEHGGKRIASALRADGVEVEYVDEDGNKTVGPLNAGHFMMLKTHAGGGRRRSEDGKRLPIGPEFLDDKHFSGRAAGIGRSSRQKTRDAMDPRLQRKFLGGKGVLLRFLVNFVSEDGFATDDQRVALKPLEVYLRELAPAIEAMLSSDMVGREDVAPDGWMHTAITSGAKLLREVSRGLCVLLCCSSQSRFLLFVVFSGDCRPLRRWVQSTSICFCCATFG